MNPTHNEIKNNPLSTPELINLALTTKDENAVWSLRYRGNQEVLLASLALCESDNHQARELGVDILGQLGIPQRTFPDQCLEMLLKLLEHEQHSDVLSSIGFALGHLHDSRAIPALVRLQNHPESSVRFGVAFGLLGYTDELAIHTLITLSSDPSPEVRNWATFGLGSQITVDNPEIRAALYQRFTDENIHENYEIYGEALVGLAKRKDSRILPQLIAELSSDRVSVLAIEAAGEIADPQLYPALMELKHWWTGSSNLLDTAIKKCQEKP